VFSNVFSVVLVYRVMLLPIMVRVSNVYIFMLICTGGFGVENLCDVCVCVRARVRIRLCDVCVCVCVCVCVSTYIFMLICTSGFGVENVCLNPKP